MILFAWRVGVVASPGSGRLAVFVAFDLTAGSRIGIYMEFEQQPSQRSREAMQKETAVVLKPAGLELAWRLVSENQATSPSTGWWW